MNKKTIVAHPMWNDAHTEGPIEFLRIAADHNNKIDFIPPSDDLENFIKTIEDSRPDIIGLSYRGKSEVAVKAMHEYMNVLNERGLLEKTQINFGGLRESCELIKKIFPQIRTFYQSADAEQGQQLEMLDVLDSLGVRGQFAQEYVQKRIADVTDDPTLANVAKEIVGGGQFWSHTGLGNSTPLARKNLILRMKEDWEKGLVSIRTHYGEHSEPPLYGPEKTVQGLKKLADLMIVSLVSLGSSKYTQTGEFWNQPMEWPNGKDDGGVPIRFSQDLVALKNATLRGNFPAQKAYLGTGSNKMEFNRAMVQYLDLAQCFQAVPLLWFNKVDSRGYMEPLESMLINEQVVKMLISENVPIEFNEAHHWTLRGAHDAVYVAAHGYAAAMANNWGVKEYIAQFMFNTPIMSSWADYAKMKAALVVSRFVRGNNNLWVETRAGLPYFRPHEQKAMEQLVTTSLLQMYLNPSLMHVVSDCEPRHAALPDDIIRSVKLALTAIEHYKTNRHGLPDFDNDRRVQNRVVELVNEAGLILTAIARLGGYEGDRIIGHDGFRIWEDEAHSLDQYITPQTLVKACENDILAAPGVIYKPFGSDIITAPFENGRYVLDKVTMEQVSEKERLSDLGAL